MASSTSGKAAEETLNVNTWPMKTELGMYKYGFSLP